MKAIELAKNAAIAADSIKAERILILDVEALTSFTDMFVIAEAQSERQVTAVAQSIIRKLKDCGRRPMGIEGLEEGEWVLIDYSDIVVHVFLDSVRAHYDLEGFWKDAEKIAWQ